MPDNCFYTDIELQIGSGRITYILPNTKYLWSKNIGLTGVCWRDKSLRSNPRVSRKSALVEHIAPPHRPYGNRTGINAMFLQYFKDIRFQF